MDVFVLMLIFNSVTADLKLPVGLLPSICYIESHYNVNAVHRDDGKSASLGVCQIKYETAKWLGFKGTRKELMRPYTNAYYAGKYLKHNLNRYKGNSTKAIIAYNMGKAKNFTSTKYSNKVQSKWNIYLKSLELVNKCQPSPKYHKKHTKITRRSEINVKRR